MWTLQSSISFRAFLDKFFSQWRDRGCPTTPDFPPRNTREPSRRIHVLLNSLTTAMARRRSATLYVLNNKPFLTIQSTRSKTWDSLWEHLSNNLFRPVSLLPRYLAMGEIQAGSVLCDKAPTTTSSECLWTFQRWSEMPRWLMNTWRDRITQRSGNNRV